MYKAAEKSYAKINIALNITKIRDDGFHELDSVMLPISLHDSLIVSKQLSNAPDNYVTVDDFSTGTFSYNLATFSIEKLQSIYHFEDKFRIFIHKVINVTISDKKVMYTNDENGTSVKVDVPDELRKERVLSDEELIELGKTLGCDIPFFIKCKPARVQGVGEVLTPISIKNNYYVLIVKPELGCSTKEVYAISDTMNLKTGNIDNVIKGCVV